MRKLGLILLVGVVVAGSHSMASASRPSLSIGSADDVLRVALSEAVDRAPDAGASQTIPNIGDLINLLPPVARECGQEVFAAITAGRLTPEFIAIFDAFDVCMRRKTGLPFPAWVAILFPSIPLPSGLPIPSNLPVPSPTGSPRAGAFGAATVDAPPAEAAAAADAGYVFFRQLRGPGLVSGR